VAGRRERLNFATVKILRAMNIRTRLVILILAVLVPAFAAGAIAVWFIYTEQQRARGKSGGSFAFFVAADR
jgi:flagellar basal body-associated protein FliL